MAEVGDLWTSTDKLHHIVFSLFCFSLTILLSFLISLTHSPVLRKHSLSVSSSLSLLAGVAKETADHFGFFHSSGASAKDAVADVIGVLLAIFLLSLLKLFARKSKIDDPITADVTLV